MIELLLASIAGYLIGSLHEKWIYFSKTGKHIKDLKRKK